VSLYSEVAGTLPADIVEAIEVSLPCSVAFIHLWNHEQNVVGWHGGTRPARIDHWWECAHCGILSRNDPRTPEIRDLDRYITIERLT
jgi:hypothetical protein